MNDVPDLLLAPTPVADVPERLGVAYQVGGSVASSIHGMARATMDVDLVADLDAARLDEFVAALATDYYVDADLIREALRDRSSFNLIHQDTMFKVDVFVPKDRPYDREAMARRVPDRLDESPGAREVCIATAEDVVLAKLEWFDRGGRTSERHPRHPARAGRVPRWRVPGALGSGAGPAGPLWAGPCGARVGAQMQKTPA